MDPRRSFDPRRPARILALLCLQAVLPQALPGARSRCDPGDEPSGGGESETEASPLGPPTTITPFDEVARDPILEAAYLASADAYYAVWKVSYPFAPGCRGVLLDGEGVPSSAQIHVHGGNYGIDVCVAGSAKARRFVVASIAGIQFNFNPWVGSLDEHGVLRATPVPYYNFGHIPSSSDVTSIDLGGDITLAADDVILAVTNNGGEVALAEIDAVTLAQGPVLHLTAGGSVTDRSVAISATGGTPGRYLVTWERADGGEGTDVWGAVLDRDLNVLAPEFPITQTPHFDREPAVDGDGTSWLVAFRRSTGANDVLCRGVTFDPATGSVALGPERIVSGHPTKDERGPSVAWMGESYLVGHSEQYEGQDYDVFVTSVESLGCLGCEGRFTVFAPPTSDRPIRMVSQRSAGGSGSEALLLYSWDTRQVSTSGTLRWLEGRRFDASDGTVVDRGGGCGPSGTAHATCALSGTPNFGVGLRGAAPSSAAILALGTKELGFSCGGCTLVPDPLFLLSTTTSPEGIASQSLSLPPAVVLPGLEILAQWIVRVPGPCAMVSSSLSNALAITVQ